MNDETKNLREELRIAIAKSGRSAYSLARQVDVHEMTVYNYLNGKSSMSCGNWEKLYLAASIRLAEK